MKVIAQSAALQEALTLAGSIVNSRSPKPVLQCVKMVAEDNKLTLMATDLEVGCRFELSAVQVEQPGAALIPADKLMGIVRESNPSENLTLETEKETTHVKGTGSHFKLYGFDPAEYPTITEFPGTGDFQIASATLSDMIRKTLFATAKAHSHYAISGVLWEASEMALQLIATDGHRLAQAKGTLTEACVADTSAIVPAKLMSMIQRIANADDKLEVKIEENQILVSTPKATLVSSLVQGNFPRYSDVIPKDSNRKAELNRNDIQHRVRQAALLTNEESRGIRLSFTANKATLSTRGPETGEAEVECPIILEGGDIEIGFNPQFLLDALKVADTEEISIEMSAGNKPAILKSGDDFLYVLMPVDLG